MALVGFNAVAGPTSVTVNGSSNPATCGCGPYYMEVQLACFSPANFSPVIPACNATTWNTYPFYRSALNIPNPMADNCVLEPYFPVVIPYANLCPGTVYVLRARERVCGSGSAGPWSANFTFTTPGIAPTFALTASASPTTVCPGGPSTLTANLTGSGGCGTGAPVFTWQPGNLTGQTVTVNPSTTTTYTVTATGGYLTCYGVTPATVMVTVQPAPSVGTASVTPPTVCAGSCVTLSLTSFAGGTLQWQSSPNGIVWNNITGGTTNPYQFCPVTAATFFRAVITGAPGCGSATSNIVSVGVTPVPTLTITPNNPSICIGQSVTLNVTGSTTYTWTGPNSYSATGSSVTISPTASGTYTVTSGGICPGTQTVNVTVNQLPTVTFTPPSASICFGDAVTVDAGADTNTYVWAPMTGVTLLSPSGDSASLAPSTTTTYNVTSTSPQGCVSTGTMTVTVNANPVLTLASDTIILCPNQTDTAFVSGATNYTWSPNTSISMLNTSGSDVLIGPLTSSTTYTVIGTTGAGCSDTTTLFVNLVNNIVVNAGPDTSICPGASVNLNATGGIQYVWSSNPVATIVNGNTASPTVTPSSTTMFTVNVTDANGCFGSDSLTVTVLPLPTPNAGIDDSICKGDVINLNGSGGGTYSWTGNFILSGANTANPSVGPTITTDYVLLVTDAAGCQNTDTVTIFVNQPPPANAGPDLNLCGSCVTLNASGGVTYSWSPTTGLSSPNSASTQACPTVTTTYVVTVADALGCTATDSAVVNVYPPLAVQMSAPGFICPGGNTQISAAASGGNGGPYGYSWAPATGLSSSTVSNPTASPATTTTYVVTVTDQCGSPAAIDSVVVTVYPTPQLTVTPDITEGCDPVCVNFTGASVPAAENCLYDFGDSFTSTNCNASHCFSGPGSYTITYTVTDVNGCVNTVTYPNLITVHPIPVPGFTATPDSATILAPDFTFTPNCINCDTTHYYMGDPLDSYVSNMNTPFNFTYNDTGWFTVVQVVVSQFGCIATDSIQIYVEPDWSFFAPNAFTPNDDGTNDIFYVYGEGIKTEKFELFIFDRWGNQIFYSKDINKGWDGRVNGGPVCQIDTYVWKCNFLDVKGNKHRVIGHVNLIR
ncbi:MAG: hypothetical protein Fur0041_04940 [Bacteroidia bacterium]